MSFSMFHHKLEPQSGIHILTKIINVIVVPLFKLYIGNSLHNELPIAFKLKHIPKKILISFASVVLESDIMFKTAAVTSQLSLLI